MTGGVAYDTGALIAAERSEHAVWHRHRAFVERGLTPVVPAPVLAQAWRGGARQANLARLLVSCVVEPMDRSQAERVGDLAARSGHSDIVDVTLIETAARRGLTVVTSDPSDLRRVALAADRPVPIETI